MLMLITRFLAIALITTLAVLNMQPFLDVSRELVATITDFPFLNIISMIPLVKHIAALLGAIAADVFGVALWMFIQLLEILPSWMKGDLRILNMLITGLNNRPQMAVTGSDTEEVAKLKEDYNKQGKRWLQSAYTGAVVAYIVEVALALFRYPPYKGGAMALWNDARLGVASLDGIEWGNLWDAAWTVVGFEFVLLFILWLAHGIWIFGNPGWTAPGSYDGKGL